MRANAILGIVSRENARFLAKKIYQFFDQSKYGPRRPEAGGHKTVSLIIPSAASGLVIGRGGENVRNIAQRAGSRVQLADKDAQIQGLNERIVSLTGAMESNVIAAVMVLQLLAQDASGKYDHLSTNYKAFQHAPYLGMPPGLLGGHDHGGYPYGSAQAPTPLPRGLQQLPGHSAMGMMGSPHAMGMTGKAFFVLSFCAHVHGIFSQEPLLSVHKFAIREHLFLLRIDLIAVPPSSCHALLASYQSLNIYLYADHLYYLSVFFMPFTMITPLSIFVLYINLQISDIGHRVFIPPQISIFIMLFTTNKISISICYPSSAVQPTPTQMTLQVNNALVPAILGRGGVVLKEIQVCGVTVVNIFVKTASIDTYMTCRESY